MGGGTVFDGYGAQKEGAEVLNKTPRGFSFTGRLIDQADIHYPAGGKGSFP